MGAHTASTWRGGHSQPLGERTWPAWPLWGLTRPALERRVRPALGGRSGGSGPRGGARGRPWRETPWGHTPRGGGRPWGETPWGEMPWGGGASPGGTRPGWGGRGAHLVGVPQPHGAAQGQLPRQQVVHPAEGELQVPHLVLAQVPVHLLCGDKQAPWVSGAPPSGLPQRQDGQGSAAPRVAPPPRGSTADGGGSSDPTRRVLSVRPTPRRRAGPAPPEGCTRRSQRVGHTQGRVAELTQSPWPCRENSGRQGAGPRALRTPTPRTVGARGVLIIGKSGPTPRFRGLWRPGRWFTSSPPTHTARRRLASQGAIEGPPGSPYPRPQCSQSRTPSEPRDWHGARPGVWRVPGTLVDGVELGRSRTWLRGRGRAVPTDELPGTPGQAPLPAGPLALSAETKGTIYQRGEQTTPVSALEVCETFLTKTGEHTDLED